MEENKDLEEQEKNSIEKNVDDFIREQEKNSIEKNVDDFIREKEREKEEEESGADNLGL